jgi:polyhydroxybutyrate depolymerase
METIELEVGGRVRRALVSRAGTGRSPAVIMLHGAGGTADIAVTQTHWERTGAATGWITAFPEGTARDPALPSEFRRNPQTWNDGSGRGHVARAAVDDVGFVAALIGALVARYEADPATIFLTGFSNGASLAFRAAAELPGRVRAIAPVAGHCWVDPPSGSAIPLLYLMGDSDPLNPIDGGEVATPWGGQERHPAPRRSFERWVRAAGCEIAEGRQRDGAIEWTAAARCAVTMRMGIIAGHGHIWPGGPRLLPQRFVGRGVSGLDATEMIGRFFAALTDPRGSTFA